MKEGRKTLVAALFLELGGRLPLVILSFLGAALAGAARGQVITEYPIPTARSGPVAIAPGPDGNLWFVEASANKIGRITTAGVVSEFPVPTASSSPFGIAAGPDGNLWFTEASGNQIGRITTVGIITEFAVPTAASGLRGITAGPDGNLWFVESAVSKIGRITTAGAVTEFPLPTSRTSPFPWQIAAGPDRNLWFTENLANRIGRIGIAGMVTEFPVPGANSEPFGIASAPDGNLWFTEQFENQIGRITPAGVITEFAVPTANSGPHGIAAGPDGKLWFIESRANKIGRITTAGAVTEFRVPTAGSLPYDIAAGPDGNLWFTESGGNKIGRITTSGSTPTPTATSTPPNTPTATRTPSQTPTPTPTPALRVLSIAPSSGAATGGTPVSVTGTGFVPGATLTIGGVMAESVVVVGSFEIDGATPALDAGTLNDVAVTNPATVNRTRLASAALARGWLADFLDVPQGDIFHDFVEAIFRRGITAGYGNGNYGRDDPVSRAQMAVLLLKGEHGSDYLPPPCTGIFDDVVCTPGVGISDWIEQLANEGITGGCFTDPLRYCPDREVRRDEMAAFLLKTEHGADYIPPTCTGVFDDVPCTPGVGFPDWIERLAGENVTGGCFVDPLRYCPDRINSRGEMAVFLVKTFALPL